jgi:ectoine hydroxylase-related dioxygenase (phytanoyl-CoA dioxygenase family)
MASSLALAHEPSDAAPWLSALEADGYCIIPDAVSPALIGQVWSELSERFARTPFCDGDFYGRQTKRFGGALKRSATVADLVMHPLILEIVERVLGPFCDRIQLNLTQALEIHPGQGVQPAHRDEDMWGGAKGKIEYLVNVMWPFTPYMARNGATLIYPGSHRDRAATYGPQDAIAADMDPGSALLFLGSTLHGGGANQTSRPRTGLVVSYCLGWLKPYENQWLVYPPSVARGFSPDLAGLVGYRQHRPNLGNYEGQCPSILLGPEPCDYLAAVDALHPDQIAAIARRRAALAAQA